MPDPRPPRFPSPEFPPRRPKLFATTPPVIFLPILGLMLAGLALRQGLAPGLSELVLGLVTGLWIFAVVAIKVKVWRRLPVLAEDLRPLPGRAGLFASTVSGVVLGAVVTPFAPRLAVWLVLASLIAHVALAVLTLRVERRVDPAWQLVAAGPLAAGPVLAAAGMPGFAAGLTGVGMILALAVWALSLRQLVREVPPAPLRPLLALHLLPAALGSCAFAALGGPMAQMGFLGLSIALAVALGAAGVWRGAAVFRTALGPALAGLAMALARVEPTAGALAALLALAATLWLAWESLKLWPGGKLARLTHAAEA